jgi:ATP synthase protein I
MPKPDETSQGDLEGLDRKLATFEAARAAKPVIAGMGHGADEGYRVLGQMLGGILGGVGLGWLLDHFAHTTPWGLLSGLLIGSALSIYATVRAASGARSGKTPRPTAPAAGDDEG